ncbi:MAG: M48 family metalloprotease [Firmicutes bacterium]|nr:M48 family metalloprotease [Bacillota bacterium]
MSHLHPFIVYAFFGMLAGSALAGLVTRLPGLSPEVRRGVWWVPLAVPFVLYAASWAWRWRLACWVPLLAGRGFAGVFLAWLCRAGTVLGHVLAPFFAVSLVVGVGKAIAGAVLVGRLRRHFRPEPDESRVTLTLRAVAERMGVRPPAVMVVPRPVSQAFTAGLMHPVVILSRPLVEKLDPEELEAVLAHELAHVGAGDHWKKWLAATARDILLFTGLSPSAFRRLQAETEAMADTASARVTGRPLALAAALLKGYRLGTAGGWWQLALDNFSSLSGAGELQRRVEALLQGSAQSGPRAGKGRWLVPAVWLLTGAILVPLC